MRKVNGRLYNLNGSDFLKTAAFQLKVASKLVYKF